METSTSSQPRTISRNGQKLLPSPTRQLLMWLIFFSPSCRHGWPEVVISNQGREFVNEVSRTLFEHTHIEHRISSAYHPQTNGLDERTNQTLVRALIKHCSTNQKDWDLHLESTLHAYRISRQDSSKFSPSPQKLSITRSAPYKLLIPSLLLMRRKTSFAS